MSEQQATRPLSPLSIGPDEPYSEPKRFARKMNLPRYLSLANSSPVVVKQFLQLLLLLFYPFWVVWVALRALTFFVFWLLFWPMRSYQAKHHPEDAARAQARRLE